MNFTKITAQYVCGIDLHGRTMYVTVMDMIGNIVFRRNMDNNFNIFLELMKPFLPDLAVGVESTYNWYWLADGCRKHKIQFHLGHALAMKAISGAKKKNDRLDSLTLANLMRSSMFPYAYPYPKEMRPTRDLLRRRAYYVSLRAAANTHIQTLFSQRGKTSISGEEIKSKRTRRYLLNNIPEADTLVSAECDLDLTEALDPMISRLETHILAKAKDHDPKSFETLLGIPGVGDILALTILYEIHKIDRFKSPGKFSSYSRVVKCARTSNNKKTGGGNQKIGNPYLKWAFDQIILRAQNHSEPIKRHYDKLISKNGKKKAKAIISHKFCVAVYYMLKNGQAFDEIKFVRGGLK